MTSDTELRASRNVLDSPFPSAETQKRPYPYYAAVREVEALHRLPTGEYVVSRHADIEYVLQHPELFSSRHSMFDDGKMRRATVEDLKDETVPWGIVNSDPPLHITKRMLAMEMFKPDRVKRWTEIINGHTDTLLEDVIPRGECEFVSEYTDLLSAKVVMSLFALPDEDLGRVLEWRHYEGSGTRYATPERRAAARTSILDLGRYIRERALERAEHPGDDELSLLVQRHIAHRGQLDMPNLVAEASNLFIGGIITTTHLMGAAMQLLIENPEQQAKARASDERLRDAIDEALRLESPVQLAMRLVTQDTELRGVALKAGSLVIILYGSANRDESKFDHADAFDIERPNLRSHLAFGGGAHVCLGARLGRLEVFLGLRRFFDRTHNLRFAPGKNDFAALTAVTFRGPQSLYIEFDPATSN